MFPITCATTVSLSEPAKAGDKDTMPARSSSAGGIPSRAIGLPGIMFATLGVSSAGRLGPNLYHTSKVTNIPLDQITHSPDIYGAVLGFNLAETTLAQPLKGGGQAQQEPNSVKSLGFQCCGT